MRVLLPRRDPGSLRLVIVTLVFALLCASGVTASTDAQFVSLRVHRSDNDVLQFQAYPDARVKLLFPSSDAWLEREEDPRNLGLSASAVIDKMRIFSVGDARHRFAVIAVSVGSHLFIFDQLYCRDNSPVMRELIRAAHFAARTDTEALDLVKLYLTLSYYRLDAPAKFVALRGSNLKSEDDSGGSAPFSDAIGVSHSPKITLERGVYKVDLFTLSKGGPTGGPVTHWRFELSDSGFDEQMAAQLRGAEKLSTDEASRPNEDTNAINFTVTIMANGFTDDGATTDLQLYSASDGPGMSRTHYYYKSHEGAETRMRETLQNALAVLESNPWQSADGKNHDGQALIIQIDKDKKSLFASQLYEDETSVLEYSCPCLRSLVLTRNKSRSSQH